MISNLSNTVDQIEGRVDDKLGQYNVLLGNHIEDPAAHQSIIDEKENRENKVPVIGDDSTYEQYPSARAVVEFVAAKLVEFASQFNNVENWIDNIQIVQAREDLPSANLQSYRKAFLIRHGLNNTTELAVCRYQNSAYYWDYSTFTSHAEFDMNYFVETNSGLSINTSTIANIVMHDQSIVDYISTTVGDIIPSMMGNYYTKEEIDARGDLYKIDIIPGTEDGSIRYYVNNDQTTMSPDIFIAGLTKIAFMNKLTADELADGCIEYRHILNRAVKGNHIDEKAVESSHLKAPYMTVFGNLDDSSTNRVQDVPVNHFAEVIGPYIEAVTGLDELKSTVADLVQRVEALEQRI